MVVIYRRSLRAATAVEGPSERRIARPSGARGVRAAVCEEVWCNIRQGERRLWRLWWCVRKRRSKGRSSARRTRLVVAESAGNSHCAATAIVLIVAGCSIEEEIVAHEVNSLETQEMVADVDVQRSAVGDEAKVDVSKASSVFIAF
eukprot:IDg4218t1